MKNLILLFALMSLLTACENENKATTKATIEESLIVEESIDELPNETDLDMDMVLLAFRKKDYDTATKYITTAINDLKEESITFDEETKDELDATIASMKYLANKMKSGKVTKEEELQEMFAYVDMLTAHQYIVFSEEYTMDAPKKKEGMLKRAEDRMENATKRMEGKAKDEMVSLRKKIKTDTETFNKKAGKTAAVVGKKVSHMEEWLGKKAEKLGIKPGYKE